MLLKGEFPSSLGFDSRYFEISFESHDVTFPISNETKSHAKLLTYDNC